MKLFALCVIAAAALAADPKLTDLARDAARIRSTMKAEDLQKGVAYLGDHEQVLFAIETEKTPMLVTDDDKPVAMTRVDPTLWATVARLSAGRSHQFHYVIDGAPFGGRLDVPVFMPSSYEQPDVPQGKMSEKLVHTSKIYPDMQSDYWIYVPAQYDPSKPAALMIWQDGQGHIARNGRRTLNALDNLTYQKRIPVMISVFIAPGKVGDKAMRSVEYDSLNDTYVRFVDELLENVYAQYNIRRDSYSRGIAGESSGGICSFNAAWQHPEKYSRVLSTIGSYTSIQWHPGQLDGGNVYPNKVRKEAKRNIRVWLQDGSEDLENEHGSWPLQNIQLANSLKMMGYDFHLAFGNGSHNGAEANAQLPESLSWLWRDYDSAKTQQVYEQDAAERTKPMFRVHIYNR
ncbi:MAG TPA: alpha/beta hydrolase-fold protein [Bryobacteraceae bacterium]|nr:alpha/beta hydrolase-fold protein [Bryobacteraceae bacterium]